MRIQTHPVSDWQANCHLVAAGSGASGSPCVVIDPGPGADALAERELAGAGWQLAAVLVTHGHLDHVADAATLANRWGVGLYCAAADQPMLATPSLGLGAAFAPLVEMLLGSDSLPAADRLHDWADPVHVAGLSIVPTRAPGHTPGSTLLTVSDATERVVFTGDVVFAGSIGRTDLPGGSMQQMRDSLSGIAASIPHDVPLLPGHGPGTTLARELATNPYLQPEFLEVDR